MPRPRKLVQQPQGEGLIGDFYQGAKKKVRQVFDAGVNLAKANKVGSRGTRAIADAIGNSGIPLAGIAKTLINKGADKLEENGWGKGKKGGAKKRVVRKRKAPLVRVIPTDPMGPPRSGRAKRATVIVAGPEVTPRPRGRPSTKQSGTITKLAMPVMKTRPRTAKISAKARGGSKVSAGLMPV